jgi:anti-sigma-K factor RskA
MGQGIHELSAAYALHALDPDEQREFEEHLARCEECRRYVADFQETAAVMAYELEGPAPPPALRDRILERARSEQPNVVPLQRRRWAFPATATLAAAATIAAVAFGIWAFTLNSNLSDERSALDSSRQEVAVLADVNAERIPLEGADGTLVVASDGEAALVVEGLESAPADETYEAWVIEGDRPRPAGLFQSGGDRTVFKLTEPVPAGAVVAVTVEPESGSDQPTSDPIFTASPAA